MSLLTKEQLKQLAEAHEAFQRPIEEGTERLYDVAHELSAAVGDLTAIIDDLQARASKQYTEQELRGYCREKNGWMMDGPSFYQEIENAWIESARKTGALKAEL